MRKISKKELYGKVTKGLCIGTLLSGASLYVGTTISDISNVPVNAAGICMVVSSLGAILSAYKSEKSDYSETDYDRTKKQLKELEYFLKESKRALKKGNKFLDDVQIKVIDYSLDDDMVGLQKYLFSEEFIEDIDNDNKEYEPVHVTDKIIRLPHRR